MTNQPETGGLKRKLLILLPLAFGIGLAAFLISGRSDLQKKPVAEVSRTLRVIPLTKVDVVPRVLGYGTASPGQIWKAVAEVEGRVAETHPSLKSGGVIAAGQTLLRIDPYEFELVVAQLTADINRVQAQLSELEVNEANYRASLKIEEAALKLAEQELSRIRQLAKTNAATAAEADAKEREILAQRQSVQSQRNLLSVIPSKQKFLNAELAVKQANLKQAELDLQKCVIAAPFSCLLSDVDIQVGQFLNRGGVLFEAYSTAFTDVEAQVPMDQARKLISTDVGPIAPLTIGMEGLVKILGIEATVRVQVGDLTVEWEARFSGIREQLDPTTRSVPLVVTVDEPFKKVIPGKRPALVKGMFCEIELRSRPRTDRIVIPRAAMWGDTVYLVNDLHRLEKRSVTVEFLQGDFVCVKTGLHEGDIVVVSDPTPAIEGMLVDPVRDEELLNTILSQAAGEGSIK